MATSSSVSLDILSDPICPWCLIGKARLDAALAERPDHPFTIVWRPFQLNPDMPPDGMDRSAYLSAKFGGDAAAARVYGQIEETARAEGFDVRFDLIRRTPSTLRAHRVIRWAAPYDVQHALMDSLFRRYFMEGADISSAPVLAAAATEAGLPAEGFSEGAITERLSSDEDLEQTREEDAAARRAGVTGAPTFIIAGRHVIPGAQASELWVRIIDELNEAIAAQERNAADAEGGA